MIFEVRLEIKKIETTTSFTNKELVGYLVEIPLENFGVESLHSPNWNHSRFTFFPDFWYQRKGHVKMDPL